MKQTGPLGVRVSCLIHRELALNAARGNGIWLVMLEVLLLAAI